MVGSGTLMSLTLLESKLDRIESDLPVQALRGIKMLESKLDRIESIQELSLVDMSHSR